METSQLESDLIAARFAETMAWCSLELEVPSAVSGCFIGDCLHSGPGLPPTLSSPWLIIGSVKHVL